jgi:hypothetical protein
MVHAWLLWDSDHANRVNGVLDQLSLQVRQINRDCRTEDQLREAAQRLASDWRQRFGSEDHHELLYAAVQDIRLRAATEDPTSLQLEHFRILTAVWSEAVGHLQSLIDDALDDDDQLLLRLGIHIDQGIRPWPLDDLMGLENATDNEPEPPRYRYLGDVGSRPEAREDHERSPWQGVTEHMAPELWFVDLEQLDIPQSPLLHQEWPASHVAMRDFVEQLSGLIRLALEPPDQAEEEGVDESNSFEDDEADQSAPDDADDTDEGEWESDDEEDADEEEFRGGDRYALGHLILFKDRLTAILNDEVIQIETQQHFLFLEAVAVKDGDWISSEEIQKTDSELDGTRIDRIYRRLDRQLQGIIQSKRGTGYRLNLPDIM